MKRITLCALLAALAIAACSKEDATQPETSFSLEVTVVDAAGRAMEGMQVQLHAPIVASTKSEGTKRRAQTTLPFTLPVRCGVTVTVSVYGGELLSILTEDDALPEGLHLVEWGGRDLLDNEIFGTVPVVFELTARSTEDESVIYRGETMGLLYTSEDVDLQPVLGLTGGEGKLRTTDRSFFPTLQELPEILHVNFRGEIGDPVQFSETVEIVARDPDTKEWQAQSLLLRNGPNQIRIVWNDPQPDVDSIPNASEPVIVLEDDIPVPAEFEVGPVYPNPFN